MPNPSFQRTRLRRAAELFSLGSQMDIQPISTLQGKIIDLYIQALKRWPYPTVVITFGFAVGIGYSAYVDSQQVKVIEQKRRESLASYATQMDQLNQIQESMKNLSDFVSQQRSKLQESENIISKLQQEKQRIEPLIQADRKVVDAVFQLQDQRYSSTVKRERWIGFGLGVLASLLASLGFAGGSYLLRRNKNGSSGTAA